MPDPHDRESLSDSEFNPESNSEPNHGGYFPDAGRFDDDDLRVGIPSERPWPGSDRVPTGYDPMGHVYLQGRAYRRLAAGTMPWWVLITGWVVFGGSTFVLLWVSLSAGSWGSLLTLALAIAPLIVLWRGTRAKMRRRRRSDPRS